VVRCLPDDGVALHHVHSSSWIGVVLGLRTTFERNALVRVARGALESVWACTTL